MSSPESASLEAVALPDEAGLAAEVDALGFPVEAGDEVAVVEPAPVEDPLPLLQATNVNASAMPTCLELLRNNRFTGVLLMNVDCDA